jgi:regulator of protease activity HflC (stomatin/prohibitin superfamily)
LSRSAINAIAISTVAEGHTGFLIVDGTQVASLQPGLHMWWKYNRVIEVKQYDLRLQNMEVNGQEILTKDKVSLRVNLSAMWQIANAELAKQELVDAKDYLYRELQLALRTIVSTQTLDELLADKNLLNQQVQTIVADKAIAYGIALKSVGARDIILPGEMKAILTQVVEAQKLAEANLIKRQEETQATRSLHNTAKVMEGNPVLLRLKELEVLEKITARINTLNVYGGLDGVMNDMVKLTDRTARM